MIKKQKTTIINELQDDDTTIHNSIADKLMILISAFVSGCALALVASLVLHYKWYIGLLYFIGMSTWVILFYEYFNYSLFRNSPHDNE